MFAQPERLAQDRRMQLDYLSRRMASGLREMLALQQRRLGSLAAGLDALSPLKVLGRGYSLAQREDGSILRRVGDTAPGERLRLRLIDGRLLCRVEAREENREGSVQDLRS